MKKMFLSVFVLLFLMVGCLDKPIENVEAIKFGVVETTGSKYLSHIHYYDEDLNVMHKEKLKYASLGNGFNRPVYFEDEIYLIPQGIFNKKDSEKVISISKKDLSITQYKVPNIALMDVGVTNDYLFTNSNLNYVTHLSKVDRKTGVFSEKAIDSALFSSMISVDEKLFLFGNLNREAKGTYLYVMDSQFNILKTIDISDVGVGAYKYVVIKKDLYVSIPWSIDDKEVNRLLKINIDNYEIEVINLDINYPDSLINYKDRLLVVSNDIIMGIGSKVLAIDLNSGKNEVFYLNMNLPYVDLYKGYLVASDGDKIALFDIDNSFKMIKEVLIDKKADTYISYIMVLE